MTTSSAELNRLLEAAVSDKAKEPAFFGALLDSIVHAHCPSHDPSGRIRFVQFHGPNGEVLLPFFSDRERAEAAATPMVRIVSLPARVFLESTLGASLVLNPNDHWCKLYPEEVRHFLKTGALATVDKSDLGGQCTGWRIPSSTPDGLVERLHRLFQPFPGLEAAYLVEMASADQPEQVELVLALICHAASRDRVATAIVTDLQFNFPAMDKPFGLLLLDPTERSPDWLDLPGFSPIFTK